ncbi:MAG: glycosyltransferase [Methanobacteriota archaeon]|nr:MAG: glycosyltransferase [Euryarchaeota archaeon]
MKQTKVTIGIVTKNRASILPRAIESAIQQSIESKEIVVIDDCSEDATLEIISSYPEVQCISWSVNHGHMYGRNYIMKNARSDYFCSLDDDAWFLKGDELEIACNLMDDNPDVAAVAFDILSPDRPDQKIRSAPIETNQFIGCGHVLRLSAVKEVGYYQYFPGRYGAEEKDLSIALMEINYKLLFLPGVHVWHEKTTLERNMFETHRSAVCNDLIFAYRRTPALLLFPSIINKLLKHLAFAITSKNSEFTKGCILGIRDFMRQLNAKQVQRKPVGYRTLLKYNSLNRWQL